MPVPKRKTSKSRRNRRSSTWFIRPQAVTECSNCSKPLSPHVACAECGFYKGAKVIRTKNERGIVRGEARRAFEAKQSASVPTAEPAAEESK